MKVTWASGRRGASFILPAHGQASWAGSLQRGLAQCYGPSVAIAHNSPSSHPRFHGGGVGGGGGGTPRFLRLRSVPSQS